jgi:hypothetical protein
MTASVSKQRVFAPMIATGAQVTKQRVFVPIYDTVLTPVTDNRRRQAMTGSF